MFAVYTPFQKLRNKGAQHLATKVTNKNSQGPDGTC